MSPGFSGVCCIALPRIPDAGDDSINYTQRRNYLHITLFVIYGKNQQIMIFMRCAVYV